MATVAPNLSTLIGELVAARLISKAGSLTSLAKCPASTVQILGAEKVEKNDRFFFIFFYIWERASPVRSVCHLSFISSHN